MVEVKYDSPNHIVLTTEQWESNSFKNWPIPRGVLCVELTKQKKTRIKIGEGSKFYRQLPYVDSEGGGDLSNYYTKEEINAILAAQEYFLVVSQEIYPNKNQLPLEDNRNGDIRFVKNSNKDPFLFVWDTDRWFQLSSSITEEDLAQYAKKSEVEPRLTILERQAHVHPNKAVLNNLTQSVIDNSHKHSNINILNQITAPFTVEEKEKLANLTPGGTYVEGTAVDIEPTTNPNEYTIGVKYGEGLALDSNGNLVATGSASSDYVAGDGISIETGSGSTIITDINWQQGSIDVHGADDDTINTSIRSPLIESGLTDRINLSATDTNDSELKWKLFYYDSNEDFISCDSSWSDSSEFMLKPLGCKYIRILLTKNDVDELTTNELGYCELSYPIEVDKYVITNTGVTHIEMDSNNSIKTIENGDTNTLFTFSDEFTVNQQKEVSITDFHRLILDVSE